MIHEFYAVTRTSIYHVRDRDEHGYPVAEKIALKGYSRFPVGHRLNGGTMIAICDRLIAYFPEGSGWLSPMATFERKIEMVNTGYWGDATSAIVALCETEQGARRCFEQDNLEPCDRRWLEQTKQVLCKIGEDHPAFEVCHFGELELLPSV